MPLLKAQQPYPRKDILACSHPSLLCWNVNPPPHISLYLTRCNQSQQIPS